MNKARSLGKINYEDIAIVWCIEAGKLHIKEPDDASADTEVGFGALIRALFAVTGVIAANVIRPQLAGDAGIPDKRLKELSEALEPDTSAIAAIFKSEDGDKGQEELRKMGGKVGIANLNEDFFELLDEVVFLPEDFNIQHIRRHGWIVAGCPTVQGNAKTNGYYESDNQALPGDPSTPPDFPWDDTENHE
jgi:uncharacterized membrane protein